MRLSLFDFVVVNLSLFSQTLNTGVYTLLAALVRLSSHGSLVGLELVALEDDTVHRDKHAVLEVNDITDVQVVDMD